jgi:hypothetical protein
MLQVFDVKRCVFSICLGLLSVACNSSWSQWEGREQLLQDVEKTFGTPKDSVLLVPKERVWIDRKKHRVFIDGYVALQEGQLEMFACPIFTKEHESVVAVFAKAATVHVGLLAVGAEPGSTAKWDPEYVAPTGSEIQIQVYWKDKDQKPQSIDARKWVRDVSGESKNLEPNWVFAGSGFFEDPETKKKHYHAEGGDLICVSNFSTAALDVPIQSTQANSGLTFVAYKDRIPERGTPVRLVLQVLKPATNQPKNIEGNNQAPLESQGVTPDQPKPDQPKPEPKIEAVQPEESKANSGTKPAIKTEAKVETQADKPS